MYAKKITNRRLNRQKLVVLALEGMNLLARPLPVAVAPAVAPILVPARVPAAPTLETSATAGHPEADGAAHFANG